MFFLLFAVVEMSFTPAKTVMLAALLSFFLGFLFSVGLVDAFASRSVHEEELIPTTAKPSMHCKKGYRFSIPKAGCHWPNSPCPGIIKFFPARETLASDIPAGGWKINELFLQYSSPILVSCCKRICWYDVERFLPPVRRYQGFSRAQLS